MKKNLGLGTRFGEKKIDYLDPSPKTITATTIWHQIELQANENCYTPV